MKQITLLADPYVDKQITYKGNKRDLNKRFNEKYWKENL